MNYREIGGFMGELRAQLGMAARALELVILTASRNSEVLNARWEKFDVDNAIWITPASRMKAGVEYPRAFVRSSHYDP